MQPIPSLSMANLRSDWGMESDRHPLRNKKIFTTCHTYIYTVYIERYINGAKTNIPSPIFISLNGVHLKHLAPYKYKTNTEFRPPSAPFEHLFKLSLRFKPNRIQCKLISFLYILKRTNKQWHVRIYEDSLLYATSALIHSILYTLWVFIFLSFLFFHLMLLHMYI